MSRTRLVKGKIFDFAEKFSYHSESSIIESSAVFYEEKSETVILHGRNPENPPSADLVDYYVKIRIKDPANYKGEFGFDWIDIDPVSEEIQKIQDVGFSDVEYFYKKGISANDLGDILSKSADEPGAKAAIKENYKFPDFLKPCTDGKIDRPFILIKLNQEISLSLEVNIPKGGTLADEKIYLTDDEFYSFEMVGGTKDPATKRTEIKVSSDKQAIELKIKCLKESSSEKKYTILQENPTKKGNPVGGFFMMENKVLKLKFRVIALVSSDGSPATKAQTLFQKFKDNDVKKYLNENSLNQAGYEVEIENQTMFDTLGSGNLDDYFYAFDKTDWTNKNLFIANHTKQEKKVTITWDAKGNPIETETTVNKTIDVIAYEGDIDGITAEEYKKKLISKSKSYNGGLIILADFEAKPEHVGAFSQTFPLDHNLLFVYSSNGDGHTYAHEIGHMLGLEHTFITIDAPKNKDDTKEYRDKKDEINDYVTKNITPCKQDLESENKENQINSKNKTLKPLKDQSRVFNPFQQYYIKKRTLILCLQNANSYITERVKYSKNQETHYTNKKNDKTEYSSYSIGDKKVSKSEFKTHLQSQLDSFTKYTTDLNNKLEANKRVIEKLENIINNKIFNFTPEEQYFVLYEGKLKIFEDYYQYLMQQWQQMISNYLYFKQNSTRNIMDYTPSKYDPKAGKSVEQRIRFLNHQILIMRKDYENNL